MKVLNEKLASLRDEIDAVDAELFKALEKRFEIVDRVINVKRGAGIPAMLPDRIEQVVKNALRHAQATKVPQHTIETLWRQLIAETIKYEDERL